MRTRLLHLWEVLTTGYWFVPACMTAFAIGLAFLFLYIDRNWIGPGGNVSWLYPGGADGASTLLSTVAGSVITVAGVAFSITIAALSQASSQFGPRLLRNFMRDTGNQVVLGTFVSTFMYCMLILRSIHGELDRGGPFVPHAAVTVAVLMASASIAVLIYFIHHVSVSLQAPAVVAAAAAELIRVIARMPEDQAGTAVPVDHTRGDGVTSTEDPNGARAVASTKEGYLQAVNYEKLLHVATRTDLLLRLEHRPGDHVIEGSTLLRIWPPERCTPALAEELNAAFILGRQSTPEQDVEFAFRQMVEIAVRALSPGINDPFTAINCIDALGAALCRVTRHGLPGSHRYDRSGHLRVVAPVSTFPGLVDAAFNQIRQYGRQSVAVTIRLLEVISRCAQQMTTAEQYEALQRHVELIYADALASIQSPADLADVRLRWEEARRTLAVRKSEERPR